MSKIEMICKSLGYDQSKLTKTEKQQLYRLIEKQEKSEDRMKRMADEEARRKEMHDKVEEAIEKAFKKSQVNSIAEIMKIGPLRESCKTSLYREMDRQVAIGKLRRTMLMINGKAYPRFMKAERGFLDELYAPLPSFQGQLIAEVSADDYHPSPALTCAWVKSGLQSAQGMMEMAA